MELAIQSSANVKVVQRMLGHESAAMTLDTYSDLFPYNLEDLADNWTLRADEPSLRHVLRLCARRVSAQ